MRNRKQNMKYQEAKNMILLIFKTRKKISISKSHNREEKEKFVCKILKIERRKRNSIQKSCEPRREREMFSQNLENREENETWKFTSPAQEGKPRVISLREFLEIETLVKDWPQLLAVVLVSKLPVLRLASLAAVLHNPALLALLQGGLVLRLVPVEDGAVGAEDGWTSREGWTMLAWYASSAKPWAGKFGNANVHSHMRWIAWNVICR